VEKIGVCDFLSLQIIELFGERGRTRTCDPCLKRALLYQLSYAPALSQYYCISSKTVASGNQSF
jgi:hypothetical protein